MTETEIQDTTEAPERALLVRTFEADLEVAQGRTVDVRIVPYGETALADDGFGGVPRGVVYREQFVSGVFSHQVNAAHRVLANVEHERGIGGIVGRGLALREALDGFYGSFKMLENADGDKALMLINEGVFTGVSVEARPVKQVRTRDGIVQRVKANLRGIAFCRDGAYPSAQVLAVREQIDQELDEDLLIPEIDPELIARCRRLGIELPQRFQAHPGTESDTPAQTGTSEDYGTRLPVNRNSEVAGSWRHRQNFA